MHRVMIGLTAVLAALAMPATSLAGADPGKMELRPGGHCVERACKESFVVGTDRPTSWRSVPLHGDALALRIFARGHEAVYQARGKCRSVAYADGVALSMNSCGNPFRLRIRAANSNRAPVRVFVRFGVAN
jgi:hypothetical protein